MSPAAPSVSRFPVRFDLACDHDEQWDVDDLAAIELRRRWTTRERDKREARARLRDRWLGPLAGAAILGLVWFWTH